MLVVRESGVVISCEHLCLCVLCKWSLIYAFESIGFQYPTLSLQAGEGGRSSSGCTLCLNLDLIQEIVT